MATNNVTQDQPAGSKSFTKLASRAIGLSQTTVAHGLGYTPTHIFIVPRGAGIVWISQAADATNVYLTGSVAINADIFVA